MTQSSHIATRWHKLRDALCAGRVKAAILVNTKNKDNPPFESMFNLETFRSMIDVMSDLPRFVVDEPCIKLVATDQSLMSLNDMIVCEMLHLPFPSCVVEYNLGKITYNILIREIQNDSAIEWRSSVVSYQCDDGPEDYVLAFPCQTILSFEKISALQEDSVTKMPSLPILNHRVLAESFVGSSIDLQMVLEDASQLSLQRSFLGLLAAVLLPQTIGLRKDAISVKDSLNRSRFAKGRSEIPNHTFLKLGTYQMKDGVVRSFDNKVEVHLRRAHKRRVAIGEGRKGRVWRFFPAQVVGYLPDGRKPTMPEMLATRAARPYLLR